MDINEVTLTDDAWHAALEDGGSLMLSGATGAILLTHTTGAEPALDAPAHYISAETMRELLVVSFDPGVKVRIRAYSEPCDLKVSA